MDIADVNLTTGTILVHFGKGQKKFRPVFLSEESRKALRLYLRGRKDDFPALWWAHEQGSPLK